MDSEVYEVAVIIKLFHNKSLQDKYLPDLMPGIFIDTVRKRIVALMVLLNQQKKDITLHNLQLMQSDTSYKRFLRKIKEPPLKESQIADEIYNIEVDSSPALFDDAFKSLHDFSFLRKAEDVIYNLKYHHGYKNITQMLYEAKKLDKLYSVLYKSKMKQRGSQIQSAFDIINSSSAYIKTSSERLNYVMGGYSKGYTVTIAARPSHNKSTWLTFDSMWQINNLKTMMDDSGRNIIIIGAEESIESFWRRVFAIEHGIPIKELAEGVRRLTQEELKVIKIKYEGRIEFHPVRKLKDIMGIIKSSNAFYIGIDHVNSVEYPNGDDFRGIKYLIDFEKEWLGTNNSSVILNLTQVNTKKMQYQKRLFPEKEDAYMSSVLEQASREFLVFYYPYKDYVSEEFSKQFRGKPIPSRELAQIKIAKNSLGDVGIIDMEYAFEYGRFSDMELKRKPTMQITEEPAFDFSKFMEG